MGILGYLHPFRCVRLQLSNKPAVTFSSCLNLYRPFTFDSGAAVQAKSASASSTTASRHPRKRFKFQQQTRNSTSLSFSFGVPPRREQRGTALLSSSQGRVVPRYSCFTVTPFLSWVFRHRQLRAFSSSHESVIGRSPVSNTHASSFFWSLTAACVALACGSFLPHLISPTPPDTQFQPDIIDYIEELHHQERPIEMSSNPIPEGHIGNLTAEQEAQFRQLWALMFKYLRLSEEPVSKTSEDDASVKSSSANSQKKKDKRPRKWSFWGDSSDESGEVHPDVQALVNEDDKWGMRQDCIDALTKHSHEELRMSMYNSCKNETVDVTMLRFLRARKWDAKKAFVMLCSTLRWRLGKHQVDNSIMQRGEMGAFEDAQSSDPAVKKVGDDFMKMLEMGHSFVFGNDKENRPVCYIRVRMHKIGTFEQRSVESYTIWMIETARLLMPKNIETAAIVFDMSGFGVSNMDYTAVKFILNCFEANYPESLGVVLVHKAPWIFSGAWALIKGWMDPVVASKVHFTKTSEDLLQHISGDNLLDDLGGKSESGYNYTPYVQGENDQMKDVARHDEIQKQRHDTFMKFEKVTKEWIYSKDEARTAQLEEERKQLQEQIVQEYWRIDPYIRARSIYDRLGFIKPAETTA